MSLRLNDRLSDAPQTPVGWKSAPPPNHRLRVPVHNRALLQLLRKSLPGRWSKVYHRGADGTSCPITLEHFRRR